jgi:hypothetical protein
MKVSRNARWIMAGFLVIGLTAASPAVRTDDRETIRLDCGVNALYVLLNLEGHPSSIDQLLSALPAPQPDGYSMAELADAARARGLPLDGVRLAKGDPSPVRPVIAFLNDPRGGHFAVLRPVGTTRTMVQVIDPPSAPWIADLDRVVGSKNWTGKVLTPRDHWIHRAAPAALSLAAGSLLIVCAFQFLRGLRQQPAIRDAPL